MPDLPTPISWTWIPKEGMLIEEVSSGVVWRILEAKGIAEWLIQRLPTEWTANEWTVTVTAPYFISNYRPHLALERINDDA